MVNVFYFLDFKWMFWIKSSSYYINHDLQSVNVMDYSLLLGVDKQSQEIVFGIIDYLRQYTWDKHLETWVKASLVVPRNEMPTVVSPKDYKKRFRKFMSTHFFAVPDNDCFHCFHRFQRLQKSVGRDGDNQFFNVKIMADLDIEQFLTVKF